MSFKEIISTKGTLQVLFTIFLGAFGFGIILPILPFYALSLGAEPFQLGMLTGTFALMSLIFGPIMGKAADKFGRKKIIMLGIIGEVCGYLLFAFSHSLPLAFAARAIEGASVGAIFPSCVSLLSDYTTENQRGKTMGLVGMTFSLGFIIGPAFGGFASGISVQTAFLLAAALSFINFLFVFIQIKEPKEKPESRDLAVKEISLLEHLSSPLLFLFLSTFMITFMIGGIEATLALYTSEKLNFGAHQIGVVFTYIGFLIMTMQFLSGNLINKFGELKLIKIGLVLSGTGFFLLLFVQSWTTLFLPLAIFVMGNAFVFPSVSSALTKKVTGKRGVVLGLENSFRSAGQMIGPLLAGFLYGFSHNYAFIGLALAIWGYAIIFSIVERKSVI